MTPCPRQSWRLSAAADRVGLAGSIGDGGTSQAPGPGGGIPRVADDRVEELAVPLLMLLAGADAATPSERFDAFVERATAAGTRVDRHTYPGAPHSLFDRAAAERREACADAWRRVDRFTAELAAAP
ncbi:dienelactone hydrolase family protein [Streptomyces sp. B6B3]|uniref:dienelactone hydrolase family protein n=1 Tax=Streptomyces sp. B6B3 TaxID=3153570 RepID=UPI00325EAEF1